MAKPQAKVEAGVGKRYKDILRFFYSPTIGACGILLVRGGWSEDDWRIPWLLAFTFLFFLSQIVETRCDEDENVTDSYFLFGLIESVVALAASLILGAEASWFTGKLKEWVSSETAADIYERRVAFFYGLMAFTLLMAILSRIVRHAIGKTFVDALCIGGTIIFAVLCALELWSDKSDLGAPALRTINIIGIVVAYFLLLAYFFRLRFWIWPAAPPK